ncbi:hypothetical protein EMIT0P74_20063 [Pseudomonas sp. IT-P74]
MTGEGEAQHPDQQQQLENRRDDHGDCRHHGDEGDRPLGQRQHRVPERRTVLHAFEVDAHHRIEIGEYPQHQRREGQRKTLFHREAVIALKYAAAARTQGFLVFGERDFLENAVAVLADDQLISSCHWSSSIRGRKFRAPPQYRGDLRLSKWKVASLTLSAARG